MNELEQLAERTGVGTLALGKVGIMPVCSISSKVGCCVRTAFPCLQFTLWGCGWAPLGGEGSHQSQAGRSLEQSRGSGKSEAPKAESEPAPWLCRVPGQAAITTHPSARHLSQGNAIALITRQGWRCVGWEFFSFFWGSRWISWCSNRTQGKCKQRQKTPETEAPQDL